jgi:fatty-acyl-CoA synthase
MCGAVLNALNTRFDAASIAFMLDHGAANALIVDREFSAVIGAALERAKARPLVIDYDDPEYDGPGEPLGGLNYEARASFFLLPRTDTSLLKSRLGS